MGGKVFENVCRIDNKIYRHIVRRIKDKLEKKFPGIKVAVPKSFSDKKDHGDVDFHICVDGIKESISEVFDLMKTFSYDNNFKATNFVSSLLYKHSDSVFVQIDFRIFDNYNNFELNTYIYSYSDFNLIFGLIAKSYGCSLTQNGLVYKKRLENNEVIDILILDDFEKILKLFGYEFHRFQQPFTKDQFKDFLLNGLYFSSKAFFNYEVKNKNKHDLSRTFFNEVLNEIIENKNKYKFEPNQAILNEIEKFVSPEMALERLKSNIRKKSSDLYVRMIETYLNKSKDVGLTKLENSYRNYLNKMIEAYSTLYMKENQILEFDNHKCEVELIKSRITSITSELKIFKLKLNSGIDYIFGFKTQIDFCLKELYIIPTIFAEDYDDIIQSFGNKLIEFLMNELNFDFSFVIQNKDIQAYVSYRMQNDSILTKFQG